MLWKLKMACEGEGPVGVTVALGSRGSFSNLQNVCAATCSQLDLDVFALLSFFGLSNHCPDRASLTHVKSLLGLHMQFEILHPSLKAFMKF